MPIYAKLNAAMPWHDKIAELPSDGARWAFVKAICGAKQRESSEFSRQAIIDILGEHARYLKTLTDARLIDVIATGSHHGRSGVATKFRIHDFDEHQASTRYDPTAVKRNREYRARKAGSPPDSPQVDNVTDTSRHDVSVTSRAHGARTEQVSSREEELVPSARPREAEQELSDDVPDDPDVVNTMVAMTEATDSLTDWLVRAGVWQRPTRRMIGFLANLVKDQSGSRVEAAIAAELKIGTGDDFMGRVAKRLRADSAVRSNGAERSRVEAERRRLAAEQASIESMRGQVPEAIAAQRRKAIADFAKGLSSPSASRKETTP